MGSIMYKYISRGLCKIPAIKRSLGKSSKSCYKFIYRSRSFSHAAAWSQGRTHDLEGWCRCLQAQHCELQGFLNQNFFRIGTETRAMQPMPTSSWQL